MNKILKVVLILILIGLVTFLGGFYYYNSSLKAVDEDDQEVILLDIEEGTSGNRIASILKKEDLIRDDRIFKLYLKINKIDDLKAGQYELSRNMDLASQVEKLREGGKNTNVVSFTIPEGYELKQIAEKLSKEGLVEEALFLEKVSDKDNYSQKFDFLDRLEKGQSLEGYLFPSTYELPLDADEDLIIETMLGEFELVYDKYIREKEDQVDLDFNEIVTLASIIERESKRADERRLISGVFHNRLKEDMKLQSCATVQYILGERKEVLSNADTRIESDYNTYLYLGLPPAPISSVGKEAILAAVEPEDVDYMYFRTKDDGSGGHIFSRTYEEHIEAKPSK